MAQAPPHIQRRPLCPSLSELSASTQGVNLCVCIAAAAPHHPPAPSTHSPTLPHRRKQVACPTFRSSTARPAPSPQRRRSSRLWQGWVGGHAPSARQRLVSVRTRGGWSDCCSLLCSGRRAHSTPACCHSLPHSPARVPNQPSSCNRCTHHPRITTHQTALTHLRSHLSTPSCFHATTLMHLPPTQRRWPHALPPKATLHRSPTLMLPPSCPFPHPARHRWLHP